MAASADIVLSLAAQIIAAHVAHNTVGLDSLSKLIKDVHSALANAGPAAAAPTKAEPAIPLKKSITAGHIVCLECGKRFSIIKRHLTTDHKLTPEQYRQKWELPQSYPLVAPDYAKTRSALAKKIGLGRKGTPAKRLAGRRERVPAK